MRPTVPTHHHHRQGNILERLSTGNPWIDTCIAALIPLAMYLLLPAGTYKPVSGSAALDAVLLVSVPLLRARRNAQSQLRACGIRLFYSLRNTYETTIRFQKEVGYSTTTETRSN